MEKPEVIAASQAAIRQAVTDHGVIAVAQLAGASVHAVRAWLRGVRLIRAESAIKLDESSQGRVPREKVRPDVFRPHSTPRRRRAA